MSIIKVVLIPSGTQRPVVETDYDSSDYTNLTALIFNGDRTGTFDRMVTDDSGDEVTFWFDDNGLARLETEEGHTELVNFRAMELYAHMTGSAIKDFSVPLVGDYVITGGTDDEGESLDVPTWIKDFPYTWHSRYAMRKAR